MNERQKAYFRAKLIGLEERHSERSPRNPRNPAAGKRQPSRPGRPRLIRDRSRDRAQGTRPPAQADLQDRRGAAPDRGRHLRLLRRDRRADRAQTPRRAPDRHAVDRGAGAARAPREGLSRRLREESGRLGRLFDSAAMRPPLLSFAEVPAAHRFPRREQISARPPLDTYTIDPVTRGRTARHDGDTRRDQAAACVGHSHIDRHANLARLTGQALLPVNECPCFAGG